MIRRFAGSNLLTFISELPVALPAGIAVFGLVAMIFLLLGQFRPLLVMPVGMFFGILAFFYVIQKSSKIVRKGTKKEQNIFDIIAVLAVVLWAGFNLPYNTQNLFVYRDPAVYNISAKWLSNHQDLTIETSEVYTDIPGIDNEGAGFESTDTDKGRVYAQGLHLLPALVGLVNHFAGDARALRTNILIGGAALLVIYGFARYLMRPRWALLAMACVGLSLPMIYFSRDTFTEPLTATFVFGALSLLWVAEKTRTRSLGLWFISGITIGAGSMVRLDLFIPILAIVGYLYLRSFLGAEKLKSSLVKQAIALIVGVILVSLVGLMDLFYLSRTTYILISGSIARIVLLGVLSILVVLGLTLILHRRHYLTKRIKDFFGGHYTKLVTVVASFAGLAIFSRPLWHTESLIYGTANIAGKQAIVTSPNTGGVMQSENIVIWIVWYLGIPLTCLGVYGIYLASIQAKQRLMMLASIFVMASVACVYFIIPSITPDQVWGARRFLPIVIPGIAIYGLYALERFTESTHFKSKGRQTVLWFMASALLVTSPVLVSYPFLKSRLLSNQLDQVYSLCRALPENAILLWGGNMRFEALQTTRSYCGVESFGLTLTDKNTLADVAKQSYAANLDPVIGITTADMSSLNLQPQDFTEISSLNNVDIEKSFGRPPKETVVNHRTILLGRISVDGTIEPLL